MIIKGQAQSWSIWATVSTALRDEVALHSGRGLELKASNPGSEAGLRAQKRNQT